MEKLLKNKSDGLISESVGVQQVRGAILGSPRDYENCPNKSDRTSFGLIKVRVGLLNFRKSPKQSPKSPPTFSDSN